MTTWVVCVPVIAPRSETAEARATWDVDAPNLLVVDNTPDGCYEGGPWQYARSEDGTNLGVAASWNRGIALGCDQTFFVSSYLVFDQGLARTVERMQEAANEWGCLTWQACHAWMLTRKVFETVGIFDEHWYPAYFEDSCMLTRMEIADIHSPANPIPKIAVPGMCPQARSLQLGLAQPDMDKLRDRFRRKYGGDPFQTTYKTPFNDPNLSLADWGPE